MAAPMPVAAPVSDAEPVAAAAPVAPGEAAPVAASAKASGPSRYARRQMSKKGKKSKGKK